MYKMYTEVKFMNGNKWDIALGLIKVDGLTPTPEFMQLVEKEKKR